MKVPVKNLLSMHNAAKYIGQYERFRRNYSGEEFQPVESFQFSITVLESYMKYVKSLSRLKGVKVTGIRIINAVYPLEMEDQEKRGQHTVLLIPTYTNSEGENEAFDPLYIRDGVPINLSKLLGRSEGEDQLDQPEPKKRMLARTAASELESPEESSFLNFGRLGKPPIID